MAVVIDKSRLLVIDPSTRQIHIPKRERTFGVYKENGVERKYFQVPKVVGDNLDLSECYIFVDYISSSGKYGQYLCVDAEPSADNASLIFSWELTLNVFDENKDATIYFSVHFKSMTEEGKLAERFSTRMAQGKSFETVDSSPVIQLNNADVILQILAQLDRLEKNGTVNEEEVNKLIENYNEDNPIERQIKTDDTLKVTEDGRLAVNTTMDVSQDNTLPITSAAVHMQIGNIDALLETI